MHHAIDGKIPDLHETSFIAWNAEVIGEVHLGKDSSIWFGSTVRGDLAAIYIGQGSNVQDNSVVHVDTDLPARIGDFVTIGHGAIIHGCEIGDGCLVGMGAIILNRARIGKQCVVGAGALITEGKDFPDRSLIVGSPARVIRTLKDEDVERVQEGVRRYIEKARHMRAVFSSSAGK